MMRTEQGSNHYVEENSDEMYDKDKEIEEELLYEAILHERERELERRERIERNHRKRVQQKEYFHLRVTLAFICVGVFALVSGYSVSQLKYQVAEKKALARVDAPIIAQSASEIIYQDWKVRLVNHDNPVQLTKEPRVSTLTNGVQVDERIEEELVNMIKAAKNEAGAEIVVVSGYKSKSKLSAEFNNAVSTQVNNDVSYLQAYNTVKKLTPLPGEDERELGLTVTLVGREYQSLDNRQGETASAVWLRENCHRFGFILRYPDGKKEVTGMSYQPWNFRYVGPNVASIIMKDGITLEEYLDIK